LECLEQLHAQVPDLGLYFDLTVYLVNDGCTDGTEIAVAMKFPEVNLIKGDGSLFWNGGMRLAWNHALENNYDYYLWINDDSMIYEYSIARLLSTYRRLHSQAETPGAILGTMVDPKTKEPTYGGRLCLSKLNPLKFGKVIRPKNDPLKCDAINGNFTLVTRNAVSKIGILNNAFTHSMGDFDYGLRLKKAGLTCWVAPGVFGECESNSLTGGCKGNSLSVNERVEKMRSLRQLPPTNEWKYFVRQHGGALWPLFWLKTHVREKYPKLWVLLRTKR
jgi:GT2 family glycosyltransferase